MPGWKPAIVLLAAVCALPTMVQANDADVAKFYNGMQMKMVIRSAPGGSYDTYARLLGRHMGRHIPGNPTMLPVNPSAESSRSPSSSTAALSTPRSRI